MRKLFFIILAATCLTACKPGIPDNVLDPEKMEKVLVDIHVADGYLSIIPSPDSSKKISAAYYKGIYKKFGIDSAAYNRSLNYYYKHPDQFSKIYEKVVAQLQSDKEKLEKPEKKKNAVPR